jgi:hypothetical protein
VGLRLKFDSDRFRFEVNTLLAIGGLGAYTRLEKDTGLPRNTLHRILREHGRINQIDAVMTMCDYLCLSIYDYMEYYDGTDRLGRWSDTDHQYALGL